MKTLLERKRKAYESLLMITEEMRRLAESGDYDALAEEPASRRDEVISEILIVDDKISREKLNLSPADKKDVMEMIALVQKIDDINKRLTEKVDERKDVVAGEISELDRAAKAVSKYVNCRDFQGRVCLI